MRRAVGLILRAGVLSASALMGAGMVALIATGRWEMFASPARQGSLPALLGGLGRLRPESITALGILLLVATPVLQLITSAALFWRERDRAYAAVAIVVLAIVALGAVTAKVGG